MLSYGPNSPKETSPSQSMSTQKTMSLQSTSTMTSILTVLQIGKVKLPACLPFTSNRCLRKLRMAVTDFQLVLRVLRPRYIYDSGVACSRVMLKQQEPEDGIAKAEGSRACWDWLRHLNSRILTDYGLLSMMNLFLKCQSSMKRHFIPKVFLGFWGLGHSGYQIPIFSFFFLSRYSTHFLISLST